jgi:hypothetical protein
MGCRGAPFLFNPVSNQVIEHTNTIDHLGVNQQEDNVDITGNEKKQINQQEVRSAVKIQNWMVTFGGSAQKAAAA